MFCNMVSSKLKQPLEGYSIVISTDKIVSLNNCSLSFVTLYEPGELEEWEQQ